MVSYNVASDIYGALEAGFDEHDIPYDVLWLDIEHTVGRCRLTLSNPQ
jgi:alpha 1,3-glucosidase